MPRNFVDVGGWARRSEAAARRTGDETRIRLVDIRHEAWDILEKDPPRALALYNEGIQLAEKLREPCWRIYYRCFRVEVYLFYLRDLEEAQRLAVDLAVEARKQEYEYCPVRARIYRNLIDSYAVSDPIGYAEQIQENLDYLERQVPLDEDTWQLIPSRRCTMAIIFDQFEDAKRHGLVTLERCQDDFRLSGAYLLLCRIAFEYREIDKLFEYAQTGEVHARRANRREGLATFLILQGICHQLQDRENEAKRLVRQAQNWLNKTSHAQYGSEILAWYYESCGDFEKALAEWVKMIGSTEKSGSKHDEIAARIEYCKMRMKMGLPVEQEVTEIRARAKQMLKPDYYLRKLDALEASKMG